MSGITFGRRYGDSIWFIITEHDGHNPFKSDGAIIMEQYTKLDTDSVKKRAQMLANGRKYGRVWMASVNENDCCEILPTPPQVRITEADRPD